MEEELRSIAYEFLKLVGGDLDKYTRTKNEVKETPEGAILFTPSHVQFAAYGRGPGKRPPLDNILDFVKDNNILFEGTDERGTAFAIQASISKKGTKNYVPNAPDVLNEALDKYLKEYLEDSSDIINIKIRKEVDGVVKETLEPLSNFKI